VTDSAYLGSESTYSECETFTDEDTGALLQPEMHEEVETDSGIEATLHDAEDSGNRSVSSSTTRTTPWPTEPSRRVPEGTVPSPLELLRSRNAFCRETTTTSWF
jgi:hypothetical protein